MSKAKLIMEHKYILDIDKELEYIRNKNKQGYKLVRIDFGRYYYFEKCEPDEYITCTYMVDFDKMSEMKRAIADTEAFAIGCGYEVVPHSFDGNKNYLYLTGKNGEVSEDFVTDIDSKIKLYKRIRKYYKGFVSLYKLLCILMSVCMMLVLIVDVVEGAVTLHDIIFGVFCLSFIIIEAILIDYYGKRVKACDKKIEELESEGVLYE